MRFIVVFFIFFSLLLTARENPFAPPQTATNKSSIIKKQITVTPVASKKRGPKIHPQRPIVPQKEKLSSEASTKRVVFNTLKARFIVHKDSVYIETKDRLKKHFSLKTPASIVMDFVSASDFASKRTVIEGLPVIKIEMGAHGSYYRVVFRLDRSYKYSIEEVKYGLLLKLKP